MKNLKFLLFSTYVPVTSIKSKLQIHSVNPKSQSTNRGRFQGLQIRARKITNRGSLRDFKLRKKDYKSGQRFQIGAKRFQVGAEITNRCRTHAYYCRQLEVTFQKFKFNCPWIQKGCSLYTIIGSHLLQTTSMQLLLLSMPGLPQDMLLQDAVRNLRRSIDF